MLTFENVLILPGGSALYTTTGRPIPESCLRRGLALEQYPHGKPEPLDQDSLRLASVAERLQRVVYLPYARMAHFGHLLTEFAGNIGALVEHPQGLNGIGGEHSIVVVPARFHASIRALADLLRVPSSRVISTATQSRPTWANEVVIPRPSMINRHGVSRRHFDHVYHVLARLHGIGPCLPGFLAYSGKGKLYLSRSRLSPGMRKVYEEDLLERELEGRGWQVVHPQELTLGKQLELLANSHTIAGCVGSAMHLLMAFGTHIGGRRLIALGEDVEQTNPNIMLQAARQGMPFRHVVCLTREPLRGEESLRDQNLRFIKPPIDIASCVDALAVGPLD